MLFISFVFLFISCKSLREITFADKGNIINLEKGELLRLKLESNPTTGYQWVLSEDIDERLEEEYVQLGVEYVFKKPVNLSTFKFAIEKSLKKAVFI